MARRPRVSFKEGSRGASKRKEIAEAILRENPGISEERKFRIATSAAKKALRKK